MLGDIKAPTVGLAMLFHNYVVAGYVFVKPSKVRVIIVWNLFSGQGSQKIGTKSKIYNSVIRFSELSCVSSARK